MPEETPIEQPSDVPGEDHDTTATYEPAAPSPSLGEAAGRVAGAFRYALVIETGPQAGLTYVLGDGATTVGRSDDADIFLGDVTVSRLHARFSVDGDGLRVADLGSTNGTYVNMERTDDARLAPGDEVIIGKFHLMVVIGDV